MKKIAIKFTTILIMLITILSTMKIMVGATTTDDEYITTDVGCMTSGFVGYNSTFDMNKNEVSVVENGCFFI